MDYTLEIGATNFILEAYLTRGLLVILLSLSFVKFVQRMMYVKSFSHIPGPMSIPIFGNALQLTGTQAEFFVLLRKCSEQYGAMFRLWVGQRPFVFLYKAEAIQPLLSSKIHIEKSLEYDLLHPFLGTGLITSSGEKWHARRKLLTPVFHYNILEDYLQPVLKQSTNLVRKLSEEVGKAEFDVVPYTKLIAMDIICEITLGKELNSLDNMNLDYVEAVQEYQAIQQRRFITPWLKPDFLFNCSSYASVEKKCLDTINSFSTSVIKNKKATAMTTATATANTDANGNTVRGGKVFLDLLMDLHEKKQLSEEDLRDEVNTFIFAGHDSTSATISWSLYVLGQYPEIQNRIVEELNENIPNLEGAKLTLKDVASLTYLECCVKEVLRMFPTVPLIARHLTQPLNILGRNVMAGSSVLINAYSLHRDPTYFPKPNTFDPERFMDKNSSIRHPFSYIPFSAGPRNCIGQKLAMMMIKIVLANILRNYKISTIEGEDKLNLVAEIVLINKDGIKISLKKRNCEN